MIFLFLYLTYFTQYDNLYIHPCCCKWDYFIFLWLSNAPLYTHTHIYIFFIHSSRFLGYLGCFHVLAIVNSTAINIGVHVSFLIIVFSGYMPRNGIAGSYGSSIFSFLRKTTICAGHFLSVRFLTVGEASCYVIGCLIERSRWQGTKGSLKPTASEELRPSTQ